MKQNFIIYIYNMDEIIIQIIQSNDINNVIEINFVYPNKKIIDFSNCVEIYFQYDTIHGNNKLDIS